MKRALPAGLLTVGLSLACGPTGGGEAPPFEPTAFKDLEVVASTAPAYTVLDVRITTDGEAIGHATAGGGSYPLYRWDVRAPDQITYVDLAPPGGGGWIALEDDVRILPIAGGTDEGALLARRESGAWVDLPPSTLPTERVGFSSDYALVTADNLVSVVDRDVYLSGGAGPDDVLATVALPPPYSGAAEATAIDDVVFVTSNDGAFAFDLAAPDAPFAHLGAGWSSIVRARGDLLVLNAEYDLTFFDVSDPHDPVLLTHLRAGGVDVAFGGDYLYGVDRGSLVEVDLSDPLAPTPVGYQRIGDECHGVAVYDDAVFAVCDGFLHRLAPNTP